MTDAVGRVAVGGTDTGTTFAISGHHALTAFHCVRGRDGEPTDRPVSVRWGPGLDMRASVIRWDREADLALLHVPQGLPDGWRALAVAVPEARFEERRVRMEGFPADWPHTDAPMRIGGVLRNVDATLGTGIPVLALYSEEVSAGRDPSGFSGGPVRTRIGFQRGGQWVVDWVACGVVRWAQPVDPDAERLGRGGQVFAVPLSHAWPELVSVDGIPTERDRKPAGIGRYVLSFADQLAAADEFVGREELLARIRATPLVHGAAYVHVSGAAGLGKTALAAYFARSEDAPAFFIDARVGTTRADQCLDHLSAELVLRYGLDRDELPEDSGRSSVTFSEILRQATGAHAGPVWLVVDALDEAVTASSANPLLLPARLPEGAFVLLTSRGDARELALDADTTIVPLTLSGDDPEQRLDLGRYVAQRISTDARLRAALAAARPPLDEGALVGRVAEASEGNFQYVRYVLADLRDPSHGGRLDLDNLPQKLRGYYEVRFWQPMATVRERDPALWDRLHRPVLEQLAVAAEPVTARWIGEGVGQPEPVVRGTVLEPWRRFLRVGGIDGAPVWRIVHGSFADFLGQHLDLPAAHRATAARLLDGMDDQYASRHLSTHLRLGGDADGLGRLVHDPAWEASQMVAEPSGGLYLHDVDDLWLMTEGTDRRAVEEGEPPPCLDQELWCALASSSTVSATQTAPPELLPVLVSTGVWSLDRARAVGRRAPDPDHRARVLHGLSEWDPALRDEALAAAFEIEHQRVRAEVMCAIAADLPAERRAALLRRLFEEAAAIDPWYGAYAIGRLVPHLDAGVLPRVVAVAQGIDLDIERVIVFMALARRVPEVVDDARAVDGLRKLSLPEGTLRALAADPPDPSLADAVLLAAGAGKPSFYDGSPETEWLLEEVGPRASTELLVRAADLARAGGRLHSRPALPLVAALAAHDQWATALDLVEELESSSDAVTAICSLCARLPQAHVQRAYQLALASRDARAVAVVIPLLPVDERAVAARAAIPTGDLQDAAERLVALARLAADMTPSQGEEALVVASVLAPDSRLGAVLTALAPVLPPETLLRALRLADRLDTMYHDTPAAAILRRLPLPELEACASEVTLQHTGAFSMSILGRRLGSAATGRLLSDLDSLPWGLAARTKLCLAPAMDGVDAQRVLDELPPQFHLGFLSIRHLYGAEPSWPAELEEQREQDPTLGLEPTIVSDLLALGFVRAGMAPSAFAAVATIQLTLLRARAVSALVPDLPDYALDGALQLAGGLPWHLRLAVEAAAADRMNDERLRARCRLLHEDVEPYVADLDDKFRGTAREQCHASILPLEARLPEDVWRPTLVRLHAATDGALSADEYLLTALTWAASDLPAEARGIVYTAWTRQLHRAATTGRSDALVVLGRLLPIVRALAGATGARATASALLDVGSRWP